MSRDTNDWIVLGFAADEALAGLKRMKKIGEGGRGEKPPSPYADAREEMRRDQVVCLTEYRLRRAAGRFPKRTRTV
jgi:hypothetical protein